MENAQLPPSAPSGPQNTPPSTPSSPDDFGLPPGTYEYVDTKKKKKWLKILEITALVVVVSIPVALSLYRVNYSIARVYEAINPAYIGTSPTASQTWGGIFTAAKKFIQPVIAPNQKETPAPTAVPTAAPGQTTYPASQPAQSSGGQSAPAPAGPEQFVYPTQPPVNQFTPPQDVILPTATPTSVPVVPTATPVPPAPTATPTQAPTPTTAPYVNPAVAACVGKSRNDFCSYVSSFGTTVFGSCKYSGGTLFCVASD